VRAVADKVKQHGQGFENLLKEKEKGNDKFAFLFDAAVSLMAGRGVYPVSLRRDYW
jgi:hypothetical protein